MLTLLLALLAAAPTSYNALRIEPKGAPAATGEREATKLVYLMMQDDVIREGATETLEALKKEKAPSTSYSVIFSDESEGPRFRFLGQAGRPIPIAEGVTSVQAHNPLLMAKILAWTFDTYPSRHRYLEIDAHGNGAYGIGNDDAQTLPDGRAVKRQIYRLPIQGFAKALRDGLRGKMIDVVFFNACLMANVEALFEIAPSVRYAVGSQLPIDNSAIVDQRMPLAFERLTQSGKPPAAIARALATQAFERAGRSRGPASRGGGRDAVMPPKVGLVATTPAPVQSIAAVDTARLAPLAAAVSALAQALVAALPAEKQAIIEAYDRASLDGYASIGDLWAFASELMGRVKAAPVKSAAKAVREAQAAAMLYERDRLGAAKGLSIFLPKRGSWSRTGIDRRKQYLSTRFARQTSWVKFLEAMDGTRGTNPSAPRADQPATAQAPRP